MSAPFSWIQPHPHGIYVEPADCWVDPSRPVDIALVTHGHADHARGGHGATIATPETLAIMKLRYATSDGAMPVAYGETIQLPGGVAATYVSAGHVLGSAQILLEHASEKVVITGDYKRRHDPTCAPFELIKSDIFISEATFGLPLFTHPPIEDEIAKLTNALAANPDRCVLIGAYALGKAAVEFALDGDNAVMPCIVRGKGKKYSWRIGEAKLSDVANVEKMMPMDFISEDGFGITQKCKDYLYPLIQGEAYPPYKANGMPDYVTLKLNSVPRKLSDFEL